METAERREPYDSRGSRADLGAPGGESPPGDSTNPSADRGRANDGFRRNLVVPGRSGKGPLTILFADLRHRGCKPVVCSVHDLRPGEPPEGELGGGIGIIRNEAGAQDTPNPSKTHRTDGWFHDGALSKLLYLGAVAEARDLVANRRSASIPLPTIRQYADAQLIVFLVVNDGAGNQYELAGGLRGEAHAVAGIKGRLHTLAHFCVSMM